MKKLLAFLFAFATALAPVSSFAAPIEFKIVTSCGTQSYTGTSGQATGLATGELCTGNTPTSGGTTPVGGNAASGATDSGNPVKVGGVYNTTRPTLTNGQRGDVQMDVDASALVATRQIVSTISTTITRPTDTNAYTANDAFANSTSAPTVGGFTFTSACRFSGGYGTILDALVTASASTAYQGEIWIFDQAVTAVNDNAAFAISDGEAQTIVGVIPFTTNDTTSNNAISYVTGLNIGYTCVGTANLRFLVKIMNAPTPGNAEVLSVRIHVNN